MSTARHRPHPHRTHQAAALLAVVGGPARRMQQRWSHQLRRRRHRRRPEPGRPARRGTPGQTSAACRARPPGARPRPGRPARRSAKGAGSPADVPAPVGSRIARTASLQLRVADVPRAAASIRTMVTGLDGYVVSEQIGSSAVTEPVGAEPGARCVGRRPTRPRGRDDPVGAERQAGPDAGPVGPARHGGRPQHEQRGRHLPVRRHREPAADHACQRRPGAGADGAGHGAGAGGPARG